MNSFSFYNPTKIVFGKDCIEKLQQEIAGYGQTVLVTYGGGSIKRNGVYDAVMAQLKAAGKTVVEMGGIMSNPRTTKVQEGIDLCKQHNVDFVLAVGGGSVIDCSKFIVAGAKLAHGEDFWEKFFIQGETVTEALPLGVILTMPATGSEMNRGAVISNWETNQKLSGYGDPLFPRFSFLDPTYTYSMPKEQMVYGIVDMLSHLMEQYFSTPDESNVSDDLIEAIFKSVMANANVAMENPTDYIARSNLMWNATLALNGLCGLGKKQDWMTHQLEHALSAHFDIPHGAGLAIVHPVFLKYIYKEHLPRFVRFAVNVWGIDPADKSDEEIALAGIASLRAYFNSLGAPSNLQQVGIEEKDLPAVAHTCKRMKTSYTNFTEDDVLAVYKNCLA